MNQNKLLFGQKPTHNNDIFSVEVSHPYVLTEKNSVWAQIKIQAPENKETTREPVDVALVIDCSGSMGQGPGSALESAAEAARFVVERLGGEDRVSVVLYGSSVQVAHSLSNDHQKALSTLKALPSLGMTALAGGLYEALEQLGDGTRTRRVFLLSDGQANVGDVRAIDIERKIKPTVDAGVVVSTFGVGLHYNEDLMEEIAKMGNGGYHFLENPDSAPDAFSLELEDLFATTLKDVQVEIHESVGKIKSRLGADGVGNVVKLGNLPALAERYILVELESEPSKQGVLNLADIRISYTDQDGTSANQKIKIQTTATKDEDKFTNSMNQEILAKVAELQAAKAQIEAVKLADLGQFDKARKVLEAQKVALNSLVGSFDPNGKTYQNLTAKDGELDENLVMLSQSNYDSRSRKSMSFASYSTRNSR